MTRLNGMVEGAIPSEGHGCTQADLEALKQDIMKDIKVELNKMKQEIIEGLNNAIFSRLPININVFFYSFPR